MSNLVEMYCAVGFDDNPTDISIVKVRETPRFFIDEQGQRYLKVTSAWVSDPYVARSIMLNQCFRLYPLTATAISDRYNAQQYALENREAFASEVGNQIKTMTDKQLRELSVFISNLN